MRDEYLPKYVTASYLAPVALNPDSSGRGDMCVGNSVLSITNNFHYRRLQEDKICLAFSLRSAPVSP